jgi:tetratricopeptide (TPR) repeat protein
MIRLGRRHRNWCDPLLLGIQRNPITIYGSFFQIIARSTAISFFCSVSIFACSTDEFLTDPVIYSGKVEDNHPETPPEKLEALSRALESQPKSTKYVADIRAILLAQNMEASADGGQALLYWKEALGKARGSFGQAAFEGWVRAYTRSFGKKTDAQILARLLLAETQNGDSSHYMASNNLTNEQNLVAKLKLLVPEALELTDEVSTHGAPPLVKTGIPPNDPLLIKTASFNCSKKSLDRTAWTEWTKSLPSSVQIYWQALVEQCSGQPKLALASLEQSFLSLSQFPKTQALALEAITRMATIQRAIGRRKEAADTYLRVVKAWNFPGVTPQNMGLDSFSFLKRRIDETLWASRYRALFGDHETAKIFAQDSLHFISAAYSGSFNLTAKMREQLAIFKADALHSLAFRIAIQKKEYQSALSLTLEALQTSGLDTEWRERLMWFAGLYEYLDGQYAGARRRWENLLTSTKDPGQRAMIYFWLARTTAIMEQSAESRFYLNAVIEEYPLSFYATVAPAVADLKTDKAWSDLFGKKTELERALRAPRDFGLENLSQDGEIGNLLRRAELLVKADIHPWAQMAIDELERSLSRTISPETHPGPYIYLTRLYHRMGEYLKAISITTKASKNNSHFWKNWPEQLLIYYPRPYSSYFAQSASDNNIDRELLYGISRQESGFTPDIRSSANAIGIMQLIRPTAERFAPELGIADEDLSQALKKPELNIRLGARYLKSLGMTYQGFPPGIYGGYNAGEMAVDLWIKHRANPDPLAFTELVPFGETKDYIKGVWRNIAVYHYLDQNGESE